MEEAEEKRVKPNLEETKISNSQSKHQKVIRVLGFEYGMRPQLQAIMLETPILCSPSQGSYHHFLELQLFEGERVHL